MTQHTSQPKFLQWLPWEKMVIWGLFLLVIYVLRHFFFAIFMTFILSYTMYGLVAWIINRFFNANKAWWLQTSVATVCFLLLLAGLYGVGAYLAPEVTSQGQAVFKKISSPDTNPKEGINKLLQDSVGRWLFSQKYGSKGSEEYEKAISDPEKRKLVLAFVSGKLSASDFLERKGSSGKTPYPFRPEELAQLKDSYRQSDEILEKTLAALEVKRPELGNLLFEYSERTRLIEEWRQGELASKIQKKIEESIVSTMGNLGKFFGEFLPKLFVFITQFFLSLLLSYFIVIDVPRLAKGVTRLKHSRAKEFYDEIAPGLVNFARLIGRAFQAQGVIAIANTILTLALIKMLGIQNAAFLSAIVFICSFIPVLGVVISGVPIAVIAFTQDGGGLILALWSIIGILVVHFIEASTLNPRILGNMLHLHPVLVLTILAVGEHFFGLWGLLLGVPVMVYIIRILVLQEGIPGLIELSPARQGSGSKQQGS